MSEAKQMHRDLMNRLLPILPHTVYGDIRRVSNLVWAIVGLCLTQTIRLEAWSEILESRAKYAASRVRRFARFLHNRAIDPKEWYKPLIQSVLKDWPADSKLYIALDTTALTPFVLIRISLIYRGRAIPLAWRAIRFPSTKVSFADYQPVLDQVYALIPEGMVVTLLADRGFVQAELLRYARDHHWHIRLRLTGNTIVHLPNHTPCQVRELCPPLGHASFYHHIGLLGIAISPLHLALALPEDQPDDPWYVVSDEPTDLHTFDEYGLRFDIEETFLDEKSGGFQLESSELATTDAIERLVLILAIATIYFTSIGLGVVKAKARRFVDTHWDRGLSYLKIGWRWLRQCYRRGWQVFTSSWLDPAPDSVPVLPSRRSANCIKRQWIVSLRC
ncbi:MAG: transposase [Ktedonobacteraceae bacterium]